MIMRTRLHLEYLVIVTKEKQWNVLLIYLNYKLSIRFDKFNSNIETGKRKLNLVIN